MFVLGESVSKSIVFKDNKPVCVKDVFIKRSYKTPEETKNIQESILKINNKNKTNPGEAKIFESTLNFKLTILVENKSPLEIRMKWRQKHQEKMKLKAKYSS